MTLPPLMRRAATLALVCLLAGAQPCLGQSDFAVPKALHIGVGGDYPNGLDGQLSARGYPWERIFPWEMNQPEVLSRFDVILLSCVPETLSGVDEALLVWIRAGGHAYVETWSAQSRFPLQSLVGIATQAPTLGDVVLTDPAHPVAAGLDASKPFDMHHLQGYRVWPREKDAGTIIARYCEDKGTAAIENAPAIIDLPLGEGRLVYSAAPVSFARFHRGRSSEGLLVGLISYLLPEGPAPRLLYTEPANTAPAGSGPRIQLPESEREPDEEPPPPAPPVPKTPDPGAPPDGFELLGALAEEPYDFLARIAPNPQATEPTLLILDGRFDAAGRALRPCLWFALAPDHVEMRSAKEPQGKPLAAATWALPAEGARLLIRRRPTKVSVILGADTLLSAKLKASPGGGALLRAGSVAFAEPTCQPVAPAIFDDNFMREPNSPTPWTPVSGAWQNLGVGDEEYSINGFYYLAKAEQAPALATAGDWFWEDYSLSAAVHANAANTQVGICALVQENGDRLAFTADPASAESPKLRLVRVLAGSETVLAEADGGLAPNQWYRLGLETVSGTVSGRRETVPDTVSALTATLDGQPVLTCPNPEPRPGIVGLFAASGSARFDDVVVRPSDETPRPWGDEGSPLADIPPSLGPHDTLTWGSPATAWEADPERPSLLWHDGLFPGDFDLTLKVHPVAEPALRRFILSPSYAAPEEQRLVVELRVTPGAPQAEVTLASPRARPVAKRVALRDGTTFALTRRAGKLTVLWCDKPVLRVGNAVPFQRLALEVFGLPVRAKDVAALSATAHDYVFGVAPVDWWASSGEWQVSARWACDDRWSWLAGWASGDAAIWNKRRFDGDVAVDCTMGVKMNAPGGSETQRCRDHNLVICGDKQDPRSGYSFIVGGDGGVKTQLLRNGQVVAEAPDIRVPAGYNVHHCWFRVRMSRVGNVVSCDFERRPVFRYEDPDPLPGGYVGLWTRNSGILVPRVTIWGSGTLGPG